MTTTPLQISHTAYDQHGTLIIPFTSPPILSFSVHTVLSEV
jgi:hypothetical protein